MLVIQPMQKRRLRDQSASMTCPWCWTPTSPLSSSRRASCGRSVSKVQTMRKEAGFEVTDHIVLSHHGNSLIEGIFARHGAEIAADTLADSIKLGSAGYVKDWEINGESVTLGVEKA